MKIIQISIAKDFSTNPGPRYNWEGENSGQVFRDTVLEPNFLRSKSENAKLEVNLDGVEGYGTSFLEEAFGGLARAHGIEDVLNTLIIISLEDESYKDEVIEYISEANNKSNK